MRPFVTLFFLWIIALTASAQNLEETYPKTLWCPNDTFSLKFQNYPMIYYAVSKRDKFDSGTNGKPNLYVTLYYGKDSLRLRYHNKLPYAHITYIKFESPKGKTTLRFHFNELPNYFPAEYREKNKDNVQFDIPEVYELANIIWMLSPSGSRSTTLYKEGGYYQHMVDYFKPYRNHAIFKALDFPDSLSGEKYYDFRENSFAFTFKEPAAGKTDTKILFTGPYYYVYGNKLADSSLFGKLKPLVEDFAAKSKFRKFYKDNLSYYQKELQRQHELLPVKQMWTWLEEQFPASKYQSYRIVSSPLIGGSHSTQRYATDGFNENVMFVCGTGRYDTVSTYTEKQKEGLMSGVVFTEIDHNYVNPATDRYSKVIDSIFSKRAIWVKEDGGKNAYSHPVSVFNEYMTHAVFCLYILDDYHEATAGFVVNYREDLMVSRRNFIRFKEFNRELIRIRQEHPGLKVVDLYPFILDWCKKQG